MSAIVTIPASIAARLWTCGKNIVEIHINRQYTFTKSWNTNLQKIEIHIQNVEKHIYRLWMSCQLYLTHLLTCLSLIINSTLKSQWNWSPTYWLNFMSKVFLSNQLYQQELCQNLKIPMRLVTNRCTDRRPGGRLTHTLFGRFITEEISFVIFDSGYHICYLLFTSDNYWRISFVIVFYSGYHIFYLWGYQQLLEDIVSLLFNIGK